MTFLQVARLAFSKVPWLSVPELPQVWQIGGDPAIRNNSGPVVFRPMVTHGLAKNRFSFLFCKKLQQVARLSGTIPNPWLSVPWLPMVWEIKWGGPGIGIIPDPWLSVPWLPMVWQCTLSYSFTHACFFKSNEKKGMAHFTLIIKEQIKGTEFNTRRIRRKKTDRE